MEKYHLSDTKITTCLFTRIPNIKKMLKLKSHANNTNKSEESFQNSNQVRFKREFNQFEHKSIMICFINKISLKK